MADLTNLGKLITIEHEGKWVAFSDDYEELVAFDDSLVRLEKKIGTKQVTYMKVPPSNAYLTF